METSDHCGHFVIRKKRHCRMSVKPGAKFCAEHEPLSGSSGVTENGAEGDTRIRIVCPLDRKHTCYAHNLKKHLKICNARPVAALPYIQKGVNSGGDAKSHSVDHKLLSAYSANEVKNVIVKINRIFDEFLSDKVTDKHLDHPTVENEIRKPDCGNKIKKHLKQASAILGLLTDSGLMAPDTCFIEFGAGRGQLSYWLAQAIDPSFDSSFLLVERSSPKHKHDNKLDKTEDKVQRIRADIADLILDKIGSIKNSAMVGVTKHLCGDATDLAMRCLMNVSASDSRHKVAGCVMTFCCHHRCRWSSYTGKEFFQQMELSDDDFNMMCGMSSWATCGTGYSRNRLPVDDEATNERDKEIGLNRSEKEEVGRRCKAILNWGRLKFLEQFGFECGLYRYVDRDVSLENVCIVSKRRDNK